MHLYILQIQSGWDEFVARQALMTQYAIDERKALGQNYDPLLYKNTYLYTYTHLTLFYHTRIHIRI